MMLEPPTWQELQFSSNSLEPRASNACAELRGSTAGPSTASASSPQRCSRSVAGLAGLLLVLLLLLMVVVVVRGFRGWACRGIVGGWKAAARATRRSKGSSSRLAAMLPMSVDAADVGRSIRGEGGAPRVVMVCVDAYVSASSSVRVPR